MQTPLAPEAEAAPTLGAPADRPRVTAPGLHWRNHFAALFEGTGREIYTRLRPTPLPSPYWVGRSAAMARELGLADDWLASADALAAFTGNADLAGSDPLASVYSGHQFGVWAGQLGDGRAILLGDVARADAPGGGLEIQLKGSGLTPYSRMGDGRAVLRSSIREFLASEAMQALGIPTTRALCVTGSDAPVRREEVETAAVVTRVAPSFVRFGHFEHFSYNDQPEHLKRLADDIIDRFYPECAQGEGFGGNRYAAFLAAVAARTARLMAQWQAVGFCHGVMNTDNMSILGLTLDYGPFQFLDGYDPGHICNHSDTQGRYAYGRQPNIAYWNLFCLGQALLPLIAGPDGKTDLALAALEPYKTQFPDAMEAQMRTKLGIAPPVDEAGRAEDRALMESLLKLMAAERTDYGIFWRRLSHHVAGTEGAEPVADLFIDRAAFSAWLARHEARLAAPTGDARSDARTDAKVAPADRAALGRAMLAVNPKFVLRNHLGEEAIRAARGRDFSAVQALGALLATPYDEHPGHEDAAGFPPDWAQSIEISCSS